MTWHYTKVNDGKKIEIYDHTGTLIETKTNDGSGWKYSDGSTPDVVKTAMKNQIVPTDSDGMSAYEIEVLADLSSGDIKRGTP
jgi:hypothetical protein